ncbi:MAG: hypothetical protein QHJ34_11630 [bacterium]|nr:hypothetical protein [candidate division KSB1 bacterium]MDH7560864.1 hypothetical protein [bacterium]
MPGREESRRRQVASYEHRDKQRVNNPPVGLVTPDTDPDAGQQKKTYAYDPHPDPQLVWAGEDEGWARLARNLRAEIDEERIEAYRSTVSLPFEPGEHRRVTVKMVDDRGIESLKTLDLNGAG